MRRMRLAVAAATLALPASACWQKPDCITSCSDLLDMCGTLFCPTCEKFGYCDTTCDYCSVSTTTAALATTTTVTTISTSTPLVCDHSVNLRTDAWCAAANQECLQCDPPSPNLCDVLFCPSCQYAGQCDNTCGFCSTTTFTTTSTSSSSTTISSTTTTSSTTLSTTSSTSTSRTSTSTITTTTSSTVSSTTLTITSLTTTATTSTTTVSTTWAPPVPTTTTTTTCYNQDFGAVDVNGKGCADYSALMCSVPGMNDADFNAQDMCCACPLGGNKVCTNTDFGSLDSFGRSCAAYDYSMCLQNASDDDFNCFSMCCACGGGTTGYTTSTTTTVAMLAAPADQGILGAQILYVLLAVLLVLCCLPLLFLLARMCCCKKRTEKQNDCFVIDEKPQGDCFVIPEEVASPVSFSNIVTENQRHDFDSRFDRHNQATHAMHIIEEKTPSEASVSVYATACEIFRGVDLVKDGVSLEVSKQDGGLACGGGGGTSTTTRSSPTFFGCGNGLTSCGSSSSGQGMELTRSLSGEWVRHGSPAYRVHIRGGVAHVPSMRTGFVEPCELRAVSDGRIRFEVDNTAMVAQVIGDRLVFDNGDVWRRADFRGGQSPSGVANSTGGFGSFGGPSTVVRGRGQSAGSDYRGSLSPRGSSRGSNRGDGSPLVAHRQGDVGTPQYGGSPSQYSWTVGSGSAAAGGAAPFGSYAAGPGGTVIGRTAGEGSGGAGAGGGEGKLGRGSAASGGRFGDLSRGVGGGGGGGGGGLLSGARTLAASQGARRDSGIGVGSIGIQEPPVPSERLQIAPQALHMHRRPERLL